MKSDVPYLDHIVECIQRVGEFTGGRRELLFESPLVQAAVLRTLQVMAESTKRLSPARKSTHPDVPWRKIADFRNVLVHQYEEIDLEEIWRVIEVYLPELRTAVEQMLTEGSMEPAPKERDRGDA